MKKHCINRFSYSIYTSARYVLLLDRGGGGADSDSDSDQWQVIRRSLHSFVSWLEEGSELSVVTFGGDAAKMNIAPTTVSEANRLVRLTD